MRTSVDSRLRTEARAFEFRFRCRDCAHFDPEPGACAEGFPNAVHRDGSLESDEHLEFCKSFELA